MNVRVVLPMMAVLVIVVDCAGLLTSAAGPLPNPLIPPIGSHPRSAGNEKATGKFVPSLNVSCTRWVEDEWMLITPTQPPPPSVLSITPNQGVISAPVPVVIRGANFFKRSGVVPTATLRSDVSITITAATADTLTGTVPAGVIPGVYALTVTNPDGQSDTLSPAYTALNLPSPDTTLEASYVATFGPEASGGDGDDDYVQVIFFEVPDGTPDELYVRIFDADTGGGGLLDPIDELNGAWNTVMAYTLRGGDGAYTHPDARSSHPGAAGINSGTLVLTATIGVSLTWDQAWYPLGPFSASDGESVGSSRVFKLVVQGDSGDDGNLYNVVLSTSPSSNVVRDGSHVFAYSWTFLLTDSERPPLYPYVPLGTSVFEQYNWDMDYTGGTMTAHTPMRDVAVPDIGISGNSEVFPDDAATSSHPVEDGEDGATWTVMMAFSFPYPRNDVTFWAVGDGTDLAIFTHPRLVVPYTLYLPLVLRNCAPQHLGPDLMPME
jgi:hypothetical protein